MKPRPADGNIVVKKGTEVSLECDASGNPVPKITWTREVRTRKSTEGEISVAVQFDSFFLFVRTGRRSLTVWLKKRKEVASVTDISEFRSLVMLRPIFKS